MVQVGGGGEDDANEVQINGLPVHGLMFIVMTS